MSKQSPAQNELKRQLSPMHVWAIAFGCQKVQFLYGHIDAEQIQKAHKANIACNLFKADDRKTVIQWLDAGLDTVLTDNLTEVQETVKFWKQQNPGKTGMRYAQCRR